MRRKRVAGLSLDKYISVDVWSDIYLKLELVMEEYVKNKSNEEVKSISMKRAQLMLEVSWLDIEDKHESFFREEIGDCDFFPKVMHIVVKPCSAIDEYRKKNGIRSNGSGSGATTPVDSNAKTQPTTSNVKNDDEYIPKAIAPTAVVKLEYTPSTVSQPNSDLIGKDDEYTPSAINVTCTNKQYSPKRIDKRGDDKKSPDSSTNSKRPIIDSDTTKDENRNEYSKKSKRAKQSNSPAKTNHLNRSQDLFGSEDENEQKLSKIKSTESMKSVSKRYPLDRQVKCHTSSSTVSTNGFEKKQSQLTGWISKITTKQKSNENVHLSTNVSVRKRTEGNKAIESEIPDKKTETSESEALQLLRDEVEKQNSEKIEVERVL